MCVWPARVFVNKAQGTNKNPGLYTKTRAGIRTWLL
jgi:hypothetical protein